MFKCILLFEAQKLFRKRNIILFFVIFIILAAFSFEGSIDYKTVLESRAPFQEAEKDKVSLLIHYTFYGIRGVRVLFIPNPVSVLFNDLAVYSGLTANVDSAEGLSIANMINGKELFAEAGGYMDFSGIMLLISSFLALVYGFNITRNKDYLKLVTDISGSKRIEFMVTLARIMLLDLSCLLLYCLSLLWLRIIGIPVNASFFQFMAPLLPVVAFFITTGAFIGRRAAKSVQFIALATLYFSLLLLIPWAIKKAIYIEATNNICSTYELEYDKLKVMMDFEKRFYKKFGVWKSQGVASDEIKTTIQSGQDIEYKKLQGYENNRIELLSRRIKVYQIISSFFPTTFYLSTNQELSGKGYRDFIRFYQYAHDMKYRFIEFYIRKKFYTPLPASGVEPFVKGDENLFKAESRLSDYFPLGFSLTLLYTFAMLMSLYKSRLHEPVSEIKNPIGDLEKDDNSIFILCENSRIKGDIFDYYRQQPDAACLEKINAVDFQLELGAADIFKHFCKINGADEAKAIHNLSLLHIDDLEKETLSHETILEIYAAIKMSGNHDYIVLDDFFKNESRQFEDNFIELLTSLVASGKRIIYLGSEMFFSRRGSEINETLKNKNFAVISFSLGKVALR